jgi:hypothetical protein
MSSAAVAAHESGHAVVSIALKIPFTKVDILPDKKFAGALHHPKMKAYPDLADDWNERYIIMLFAGGIAQRRFAPRSHWRYGVGAEGFERDYYYDEDGDLAWVDSPIRGTDFAQIADRLVSLGRYSDDAAYRAELEARAKALVKKLYPEIKFVAAELLKRRTLTQTQVRRLMNRARRHPRTRRTKS